MIRRLTAVFGAFVLMAAAANAADVIEISSFDELCKIGADKGFPLGGSYALTRDIDASSSRGSNGGAGFEPIGRYGAPFTGTFDGKGYAVRGLYVNRPNASHAGLFGYVNGSGARISNLGVIADTVTGSFYVGALAGLNNGAVIGCYSSGVVRAYRQESDAGGLVGANGGTVSRSYSTAAVSGKENVGGLAGMLTTNYIGTITNSYAAGKVSGSKNVGGLVGYAFGGLIDNCFSTAQVSGTDKANTGGLVGGKFDGSGAGGWTNINSTSSGAAVNPAKAAGSFFDKEAAGVSVSAGGTPMTPAEIKTAGAFKAWVESGEWVIDASGYPQLNSVPVYTVIYKAGSNGKLTINDTMDTPRYEAFVKYGPIDITIEAAPNTGYRFTTWSDGKTGALREDSVIADMEVTANFAINAYPLKYSAGTGGTITGDASQTVKYGSDGSEVTAVPNTGYHFVKWDDGVTENSRTDRNITGDKEFAAEFAPNAYTLTYMAEADGTIEGDTIQKVDYMSSGSEVKAAPNAGYSFTSWSDGKTDNPRRDTVTYARDTAFTASFKINTYTLKYTAGEYGKLEAEGNNYIHPNQYVKTLRHGQTAPEVKAVPVNENVHDFSAWSDGVTQSTRADIAASDTNVTAIFLEKGTYLLTYIIKDGGAGTFKIDGVSYEGNTFRDTVQANTRGKVVEAVAGAHHHFIMWEEDGSTAGRRDEIATENKTFSAVFAIDTHTVTYTAGTGGTISGSNAQILPYGETTTPVTAVPNEGYNFVKWNDGKTATRTDNVTEDITFTAAFTQKTYTLTYIAETNGKISINNGTPTDENHTATVAHGDNGPSVKAVPDNGYHFVKWEEDDNVNDARSSSNVTENATFTAVFAPKTITLTYKAGNNGKLKIDNATQESPYQTVIDYNTTGPEVTAVPNDKYRFVKWDDDKTDNPRTDVAKNNITVTALFEEDVIEISSFEGLCKIGIDNEYPLDGYYVLTDDIDASNSSTTPFKPIGGQMAPFTGRFDGKNYAITGLYFNDVDANYVGLFGYVGSGGIIRNVRLVTDTIKGKDYVGGLAGYSAGEITNCYSTGYVGGRYVGGLVGINANGGKIKSCYTAGEVNFPNFTPTDHAYVGGLAGRNYGLVEDSYSTALVKKEGYGSNYYNTTAYVGGLVGYNSKTITNCYFMGNIYFTSSSGESSHSSIGTIIGYHASSGDIVNSYFVGKCFWEYEYNDWRLTTYRNWYGNSGIESVGNYTGVYFLGESYHDGVKQDDDLQKQSTYENWDFINIWRIKEGSGYPRLRSSTVEISSFAELCRIGKEFGYELDRDYVLTQDIDASASVEMDDGNGFEPIGKYISEYGHYYDSAFTGTFNGKGFTISDLSINRPSSNYVGLFGYVYGGEVCSVNIANARIIGQNNVGGLAGSIIYTDIRECGLTDGDVRATINVGGLLGSTGTNSSYDVCNIIRCYVTNVTVTGTTRVGGLAGSLDYSSSSTRSGNFSECYSTEGTVNGIGDGSDIGGLIGYSYKYDINLCYTTRTQVDGANAKRVGGLVGFLDSKSGVNQCYFKGNVNGYNYVGGLVGGQRNGTMSDSYFIGEVTAIDEAGALAGAFQESNDDKITRCYAAGTADVVMTISTHYGYNPAMPPKFEACYYDNTNISQAVVHDNSLLDVDVTGKSSENMKNEHTYVNWDFANTWAISPSKNGGYPYLKWAEDIIEPRGVQPAPPLVEQYSEAGEPRVVTAVVVPNVQAAPPDGFTAGPNPANSGVGTMGGGGGTFFPFRAGIGGGFAYCV